MSCAKLGFFKYESRGISTPELIDNDLSVADVKGKNMIDNTMYGVVHTATSYVYWEYLESSIDMQFTKRLCVCCFCCKLCLYLMTMEMMD